MVDFESWLKKAWYEMGCTLTCPVHAHYEITAPKYCKGHAALLEMVDGYAHMKGAVYEAASGSSDNGQREADKEYRRLRAAVGVDK